MKISMVQRCTDTKTTDIDAHSAIIAIRFGRWKKGVEQVRQVLALGDKAAAEKAKKALAALMWSGRFKARASNALIKYSGLICADLDDLGDRLPVVRGKLERLPQVVAVFVSPSGKGLKVLVRVPADPARHSASWLAVEKLIKDATGIQIDQSGKDVARLCFVSYDPLLYYNEHAIELALLLQLEKPPRAPNLNVGLSARQRITEELLGSIEWVSETSGFLTCPGKHLHTTGEGERDCKIDLDNVPTLHCFHNHCGGIQDGVNKELRSRIGRVEYKPEGCAKSVLSALSPSITTLNEHKTLKTQSLEVPLPLGEAAYHGLAGRFVQRVEPETEGDPAALLIQWLVAFGNAIGRQPHTRAEATRHGMNLYAVTVGKTAKARKGTSWDHVKRVFWHADRDWTENNITGGLSTGEGLIHNVRDPIIKTVKDKPEVVDDGVNDKRLLIFQGELSGVLKVMGREGNTLSSVLRDAWDGVRLSTLAKHSGETATDTHISIAAHITREEVRKQLTETESANGFGNRFLWPLVKRSKYLPEGGLTPAIADIVTDLQAALEFSRNTDLITRTEAARKLWAEIYPALSEGLPGLVGALTARAEAQVLRMSCIYALLDCSAVVDVPHLKAALEVWRYCEDSATLIFESGTGDKNADRILHALKVVGEQGLSKTEMRTDIFNNHISSFDLDEALRLLHRLDLAHPRQESTTGRTAERWFYENKD
jgi:VirE-like protein/uncharacterized protein DUF3987